MQKRKLLGAALTGALTVSMLMGGCGKRKPGADEGTNAYFMDAAVWNGGVLG